MVFKYIYIYFWNNTELILFDLINQIFLTNTHSHTHTQTHQLKCFPRGKVLPVFYFWQRVQTKPSMNTPFFISLFYINIYIHFFYFSTAKWVWLGRHIRMQLLDLTCLNVSVLANRYPRRIMSLRTSKHCGEFEIWFLFKSNKVFQVIFFVSSDSVDSLNYKFEDGCSVQTAGSLCRVNIDELNKEFSQFDSEFNVNNWADLQSDEVDF